MPTFQNRPQRSFPIQARSYGSRPARHLALGKRNRPQVSGETSPEWEFVKTNKWYLIGGGLLAAAAITYFVNRGHALGHDY